MDVNQGIENFNNVLTQNYNKCAGNMFELYITKIQEILIYTDSDQIIL